MNSNYIYDYAYSPVKNNSLKSTTYNTFQRINNPPKKQHIIIGYRIIKKI
jgi:hypothetical protein